LCLLFSEASPLSLEASDAYAKASDAYAKASAAACGSVRLRNVGMHLNRMEEENSHFLLF